MSWRGVMSIDGKEGQWSKEWGIVPMAEWHWGGDGSVVSNILGAPGSTPLYLCLPSVKGTLSGDHYFPTICWCIWRHLININPLSAGILFYRHTCTILLSRRTAMLATTPGSWHLWQSWANYAKKKHKVKTPNCETLTSNPSYGQFIWHIDAGS